MSLSAGPQAGPSDVERDCYANRGEHGTLGLGDMALQTEDPDLG
jgi:hypothetical protein